MVVVFQKLAEVKLEVRDREEQVQEKQVITYSEQKVIPGQFYEAGISQTGYTLYLRINPIT